MGKILVTGGAGYIGSHTVVKLLEAGYQVVIIDNFENSCPEALNRIRQIAGKEADFYKADVCHKPSLDKIFKEHKIDGVIHFAGLKAVGESVNAPIRYYDNNIMSTINLIKSMNENNVKNLVFSSSCTIYGIPESVPVREDFPQYAVNPYGMTKLVLERMLSDLYTSDNTWNIALLRYFNPVGAHPSGKMGEDPNGIPNNLAPFITQVAAGKLEKLKVFGNDYDTKDGTAIRDYIHVVDLADGHLAAIKKLDTQCGLVAYNLGTGVGYTVLEVINAFEEATGKKIPYEIVGRRAGDAPYIYGDPTLAQKELGWKAVNGIEKMAIDSWNWQKNNPNGYK